MSNWIVTGEWVYQMEHMLKHFKPATVERNPANN